MHNFILFLTPDSNLCVSRRGQQQVEKLRRLLLIDVAGMTELRHPGGVL